MIDGIFTGWAVSQGARVIEGQLAGQRSDGIKVET